MFKLNGLRNSVMICFILAAATAAAAEIEDFDGLPAGHVVAGERPDGTTAPGTDFAGFTLSVVNNGGGPGSMIIFDSANPTGGDWDLGTPNETCGGPGIGEGGEVGMPGANCVPMGNLLIVAEDLGDGDNDNIVDDPDDEGGGGIIRFDFDHEVDLEYLVIIDIDGEFVDFTLSDGGVVIGTAAGNDLGENSAQTVDLTAFEGVRALEIEFSNSGAVAELGWELSPTPTRKATWGELKRNYR